MPLTGPILVVTESPAADLVASIEAAGAFPIIELGWAEATSAVADIAPAAVILAEPAPVPPPAAEALAQMLWQAQPLVPLFARVHEGAQPSPPQALPLDDHLAPARFIARLRSAMRVRSLHAAVLRRSEALPVPREPPPFERPRHDPLDDATVLIVGRGRSYPALTLAVGERVGIVGSFSVEAAARYLNARDIDGIVIGDGLATQMVEAFLIALSEDVRFRDLPIALLGERPELPDGPGLANLISGTDVEAVVAQVLPLVGLHAVEAALKRTLRSLDAGGLLDGDTGLLTQDAFRRNLVRAVAEAQERGGDVSLARFAFDTEHPSRAARDAARLFSRLMRSVDFACVEIDGSIVAAFTETDLRAAHVIARRLASILKHTMLAPDRPGALFEPSVTLATFKANDTVETLVSRVLGERTIATG